MNAVSLMTSTDQAEAVYEDQRRQSEHTEPDEDRHSEPAAVEYLQQLPVLRRADGHHRDDGRRAAGAHQRR